LRLDWLVSGGLIGVCLIVILVRRSPNGEDNGESVISDGRGRGDHLRPNVRIRSIRSSSSVNVETIHGDKIVVTGLSQDAPARETRPEPSSSFTLGYLNAKASWIAICAINALCLNKSGTGRDVFAKYIRASDLGSTLSELRRTASDAGWPSPGTIGNLTRINGPEQLIAAVHSIFSKAETEEIQKRELESLVSAIENLTKDVFIDAHRANADLGMLFLGGQIGKIDAILILGIHAGEPELDKLVPACRGFIRAIFLAYLAPDVELKEQVSWIIADSPNLGAKVDSMTSAELAMFVSRAKNGYLLRGLRAK